jgi:hypothetical protein
MEDSLFNPQDETPFEEVLVALLDDEQVLDPGYLYRLSDITQDDQGDLTRIWSDIQVERRRALIEDLEDLSEDNNLLSFESVFRLSLKDEDSQVRFFTTRAIEIYDTDGNFIENTIVGGTPYLGCFNSVENKMYFYTERFSDIEKSNIYVFDTQTNEFISTITFDHSISDLQYDEGNNCIYVSSYSETNLIKIIDCETDDLPPEIPLDHNYCRKMFIANNTLYCAVQNNNGSSPL